MPDWTAITGIVVSGVIGPSIAATVALLNQKRNQRHGRDLADVAELRKLLSEASADLREAQGLRAAAGSAILTHGEFVVEREPNAPKMLREIGRKVLLQSEQIALLVGADHPVATAHREAGAMVEKALNTLLGAKYARDAEAREDWAALLKDDEMAAARQRFLTAAHQLVGSRVEPDKKRRLLGRGSG